MTKLEELLTLFDNVLGFREGTNAQTKAIATFKAALSAAIKPNVEIDSAQWDQVQVCTWIGNQLMTQPSMFERNEVCKFVRSLGRNEKLAAHFHAPLAQTPMQKVAVPPPGVDIQEVMYACGWNDACEKFGNPVYEPTPPVVIEVTHYTDTPPPRLTWVGLSTVVKKCRGYVNDDEMKTARAIESAVRKQFGVNDE